jgi:preprotein translocase subunit SecG
VLVPLLTGSDRAGTRRASKFRAQGRPDTLERVAWIGGTVLLVLGIVVAIATSGHG